MEFSVFPIVETFEEVVDGLLTHQFPAVRDFDLGFGSQLLDGDADTSACRGVFRGIREQVIDDLVDLVGIEPSGDAFGRGGDRKMQILPCHQWREGLAAFAYEGGNVALRNAELEIPAFGLAELENLLDQTH